MAEFIEGVSKETDKQIKQLIQDLFKIEERIDAINKKSKTAFLPSENKKIIQEINTEIGKSNKLISETEKFNKKLAQSEEAVRFAKSKVGKQTVKNRQEAAKLNKETRSLGNAYAQLLGKLSKAEERYRNIAASTGQFSKQTQRAQAEVNKLRKRIDAINTPIKRFGNNVGNYPKLFGNAARSVRSFTAAFGFTSGIFLLADAVRSGIRTFKDFDQAQADLAAILGTNRENIKDLTDQALELGATTAFTATQVAELQLELSKLGFNRQEIIDATLGVENLAIATGVDAARAAKLAGASIKGFALDASEANRVAAALAVSTTKSANSFETLEVALPKVSAIANAFGFTIEDTTALLGSLQNSGLEASIAGTSLRQIFLQLADANGKLAKRLGGPAKSLDELVDQFKNLEKSGIDLGEAFKLTNARSVAAFKIFLKGADDIKTLRDSITDVESNLDDLANEKLNSVSGQITLLNSAWEGWILSLDESNESSKAIKDTIAFLTKNLSKILNTIIKVGKAFLIYKGILLATSLISKVYTAGIVALRIAKIALSGGIGKAVTAMKAFNVATKANPIGLITSVVAGAVATWLAFRDGVKESAEALKNAREEANKTRKAIVAANIALVKDQLKRIDATIQSEQDATAEKIKLIQEEIQGRKDGSKVRSEVDQKILKEELATAKKIAEAKLKFQNSLTEEQGNEIDLLKKRVKEELQIERNAIVERNKVRNTAQTENVKVGDLAGTKETIAALTQLLKELEGEEEKIAKKTTEVNKDELKKRRKDRFELQKLILQDEINTQDAISKDQSNSLVERLVAQRKADSLRGDLIEQQRDFDISNAEGRSTAILVIEKKFEIDNNKITKKGVKTREDILKSDLQKKIKNIKKISDLEKIRLAEELEDLRDALDKKEITRNQFNKAKEEALKRSDKRILEAQIDFIEKELLVAVMSAEKRIELEKKVADLKAKLTGDQEDDLAKIQKAFSALGSEILGISTDNLGNIFNGLKNGFEEAGDAAVAFGQLASEALASLNAQQQIRFEAELERLDKEKEIALAFAGENAEARGAIEEDFEEKKVKIKQKAAEREKENAIFSAVINTAAAVVAAAAEGGIPLAIAVGLLGAAQIALIASTPIPQFADGTDFAPGGLSLVNDQRGSSYKEMIKTPKGDILRPQKRNTLIDLPRGSQVFTATETQAFDSGLNSLLANNGILPMRENLQSKVFVESKYSGITPSEMDGLLSKNLSKIQLNSTHIDKRGVTTFAANAYSRVEKLNNRVNFRGKKV